MCDTIDRHAVRTLAPHGAGLSTYRILLTLDAFGDMSSAELTRYVVLDKAQISRRTADLTRAGLIESVADPKRPRRRRLRLSVAGRDYLDAVLVDMNAREAKLAELLDDDELATFVGVLDKLTDRIATDLADS